jgi:hypothetical protein
MWQKIQTGYYGVGVGDWHIPHFERQSFGTNEDFSINTWKTAFQSSRQLTLWMWHLDLTSKHPGKGICASSKLSLLLPPRSLNVHQESAYWVIEMIIFDFKTKIHFPWVKLEGREHDSLRKPDAYSDTTSLACETPESAVHLFTTTQITALVILILVILFLFVRLYFS